MAQTKATKERQADKERRGTSERRKTDRRQNQLPVGEERRSDDRRKVQRRRQIDPTTCERDYSDNEIEFMNAMDNYKRDSGRMFPTCSEILEVIRSLGYVQLDDAQREQLGLSLETLPVGGEATNEEESLDDIED